MRTRGAWPGRLTLRSGWAKAVARPWNDDSPDAAIRLERGSAEFLRACTAALCRHGVRRILTPPLDPSMAKVWLDAGFEPALPLDLYRRSLVTPVPEPAIDVVRGSSAQWAAATTIDDAAFAPEWRMGSLGLEEARDATPDHEFLAVDHDGQLAGFVIVGRAMTTAYLQRLAVDPAHQGTGLGRALVRAACRWGVQRGALEIILNTQPENEAAGSLYAAEGFEVAPGALAVLGSDC